MTPMMQKGNEKERRRIFIWARMAIEQKGFKDEESNGDKMKQVEAKTTAVLKFQLVFLETHKLNQTTRGSKFSRRVSRYTS